MEGARGEDWGLCLAGLSGKMWHRSVALLQAHPALLSQWVYWVGLPWFQLNRALCWLPAEGGGQGAHYAAPAGWEQVLAGAKSYLGFFLDGEEWFQSLLQTLLFHGFSIPSPKFHD